MMATNISIPHDDRDGFVEKKGGRRRGRTELAGPFMSLESQQNPLEGVKPSNPMLSNQSVGTPIGTLTPLSSSPASVPVKHYRDIAPRRASEVSVLSGQTFAYPRSFVPT